MFRDDQGKIEKKAFFPEVSNTVLWSHSTSLLFSVRYHSGGVPQESVFTGW